MMVRGEERGVVETGMDERGWDGVVWWLVGERKEEGREGGRKGIKPGGGRRSSGPDLRSEKNPEPDKNN